MEEKKQERNTSVDLSENRSMVDKKCMLQASLPKSKPLFKKLQREFQRNVLLPELERTNEVLKQRKEYMKPVTRNDLLRHER